MDMTFEVKRCLVWNQGKFVLIHRFQGHKECQMSKFKCQMKDALRAVIDWVMGIIAH
jgi:hypothetical protein